MDYSLLLSIKRNKNAIERQKTNILTMDQAAGSINAESQAQDQDLPEILDDGKTFFSSDKTWCYQVSIIDYL